MGGSYALTEIRGDWKWHRELWDLKRHYKCKDLCHLCFASIHEGPTQYFGLHWGVVKQMPDI